MKRTNVIVTDKDWWKGGREPSEELVVTKPVKVSGPWRSVRHWAELFGVSYTTIYDATRRPANQNRLETQRIGGSIRIAESVFQEWLARENLRKRRA